MRAHLAWQAFASSVFPPHSGRALHDQQLPARSGKVKRQAGLVPHVQCVRGFQPHLPEQPLRWMHPYLHRPGGVLERGRTAIVRLHQGLQSLVQIATDAVQERCEVDRVRDRSRRPGQVEEPPADGHREDNGRGRREGPPVAARADHQASRLRGLLHRRPAFGSALFRDRARDPRRSPLA